MADRVDRPERFAARDDEPMHRTSRERPEPDMETPEVRPARPGLSFSTWLLILFVLAYGAGVLLLNHLDVAAGQPVLICRFRAWTGLPCPTCGSTRAALELLQGNFRGAFQQNPLVTTAYLLALPGFVWWFGGSRRWWKGPRLHLSRRPMKLAVAALLLAVAANWAYLLLSYKHLPGY